MIEPAPMTTTVGALRTAARQAGHLCIGPGEPGLDERTPGFHRLRHEVLMRADRVLLWAWQPAWCQAVPAPMRPVWADEIDAARGDGAGQDAAGVLDKGLLLRHPDELAVIKPRVRWRVAGGAGAGRPESASPGDVLLHFDDLASATGALRAGAGPAGLAGSIVSRGMDRYFSAGTWRMLRQLAATDAAGPVLVGLNPANRCLDFFGNDASMAALVDSLAPLLIVR